MGGNQRERERGPTWSTWQNVRLGIIENGKYSSGFGATYGLRYKLVNFIDLPAKYMINQIYLKISL